jgi:hypothetical protein
VRDFYVDDVLTMRSLRRAGSSMREVKANFRRKGFTDDQTVALFHVQLSLASAAQAAAEANRICMGYEAGYCPCPVKFYQWDRAGQLVWI